MTSSPQNDSGTDLAGLNILLAEDEMMVAMSLADLLGLSGVRIITAGTRTKALARAQDEPLDGALLDVNLGDAPVYPVAEALAQRAIPFIFLTGYSAAHIEARWRDRPVLEKPYDPTALIDLMAATFAAGR